MKKMNGKVGQLPEVKNVTMPINTWDAPLQKISALARDAKYAEAMLALKKLEAAIAACEQQAKSNSASNIPCRNPKE